MMNSPIAYFCAEYALNPDLPIYAGGLGILAGDYLREAADQNFPIIGVGLFYDYQNPVKLDFVLDNQGNPLRIEVPIQDRRIKVQVFVYMVGPNPVYLLNTNISENAPADRQITNRLYVDDKETRLKQELVLGLGGQRVLETLKISPSLYHLNEGHSAFLVLELIRHQMRQHQQDFEEAVAAVKEKVVFTNHTLVVAGREVYSNDLVAMMLAGYAEDLGIPISKVIDLGLVQESSSFSMTMFSLRLAGKINAVSKIHAKKAAEVWADHPMISITNGVHVGTWDIVKDLARHSICKQNLLQYIKQETGIDWKPEHLLLGWARRFVEYKRPLAILDNLQWFKNIAKNSQYPVKIVFSGELPADDERSNFLHQKLADLIKNEIGDCAVFLPHYNMNIGKILVAGCDVWLNTPIVGFEACGTSSMKAALNGVLPASTKDGWIDEVDLTGLGWLLESDHLSENILEVLEKQIVPFYYQHPSEWQNYMRRARDLILQNFTTTRMLREYQEKLYPKSSS
jgi:starch phosphorylase